MKAVSLAGESTGGEGSGVFTDARRTHTDECLQDRCSICRTNERARISKSNDRPTGKDQGIQAGRVSAMFFVIEAIQQGTLVLTITSMEHRMGFEPMNTGFADQRVSHFATGALVHHATKVRGGLT
jgi:hypothetical protein